MKNKIILLSFSLIVFFPAFVSAQVYLPPPPPVVKMPDVIWNNHMMNKIRIDAVGQAMINDSATAGNTKGKANNNAANNTQSKQIYSDKLAFKYSGYSLLAEKFAQNPSQKMSDDERRKLDQLFSGLWGNFETSFKEENQRLGMPYNDLATAMTFYILNNYMIANDLTSLEAEKSVAVYNQVAPVLLGNQEIVKMAEKDKELLAEVFVSLGGMPNLILQATRDAQQSKQAARQNLERIFGQNAAKIKITAKGIEI